MVAHLHELALFCTPASGTALDAGEAVQDGEKVTKAGRQAGRQVGRQTHSVCLSLCAIRFVGWLTRSDISPPTLAECMDKNRQTNRVSN